MRDTGQPDDCAVTEVTPNPIGKPPEVAEFLGISEQSLAQDRARGLGPPYIKHGRRVRYRWADVEAYLSANTVTGGHHAATG